MKSIEQVPKVRFEIRFVVLDRDVVDSRRLASFQSAKGVPQQLVRPSRVTALSVYRRDLVYDPGGLLTSKP
jgi:hypothetical protein